MWHVKYKEISLLLCRIILPSMKDLFILKMKEGNSSSASENLLNTMPAVKSPLKLLLQENEREFTISKTFLNDSIDIYRRSK